MTLEAMDNMEAEACAHRFLNAYYRHHSMPQSIVSDQGSNWVSKFWRKLCKLAGIEQ
jgi:transposase InsO family protein